MANTGMDVWEKALKLERNVAVAAPCETLGDDVLSGNISLLCVTPHGMCLLYSDFVFIRSASLSEGLPSSIYNALHSNSLFYILYYSFMIQ